MKIINGINPLASGIDWLAIPDLAEFWKEHAPANAEQGGQRCVWLSREDCSVKDPLGVKLDEAHAFNPKASDIMRRSACDALLMSFCPVKTVKHLVEKVKLPRDFAGVIAFDHEIPAWMSCLHIQAYNNLWRGITGAFPDAQIREYAGVFTDWVLQYSKPDRLHELDAMDRVAECGLLHTMPSLYIPGREYFKDLARFEMMVRRNVKRWCYPKYIAVSPIIEGTYKNGDYTSGDVVPVEVMRIILQAIADAGAAAVLWGAAANDEQAGRLLRAVQESVVKAAEGVK